MLSLSLLYSTAFYHGSISLNLILHYNGLTSLDYTLLPFTIVLLHFTSLFTLLHCTIAVLHPLPLFYFSYFTLNYSIMALRDSTLLYHGFTSVYLTLHYSAIALLPSNWLYWLYTSLHGSSFLYCLLPSLYFTLPTSIIALLSSTLALLHCT